MRAATSLCILARLDCELVSPAPLTWLAGPVVSYNVWMLLAPVMIFPPVAVAVKAF